MENFIRNIDYRKLIFPTAIIILNIIGFVYLYDLINNVKKEEPKKELVTLVDNIEEEKKEDFIYIDVKGYVKKSGVYKLESGSRVTDAINAAGGLKSGANTRFINLSKILSDGEVVVIYSSSEIEKAKKNNTIIVETPCVCEEVKNDACYEEPEKEASNKININVSDVEGLMTLSGIGESKALAIINYRNENGLFKSIEDIVNVSGISEAIFSKIKENITV